MSAAGCREYIIGVIDGMTVIAAAHKVNRLFCPPRGVTAGQMTDVVNKYLSSKPEIRHLAASDLVFGALYEVFPCKELQSK